MINFTLNGQAVQTDADPSTPLLWVVRDHFKLKGSKFGCGAGLCGACTMHVDGAAMKTLTAVRRGLYTPERSTADRSRNSEKPPPGRSLSCPRPPERLGRE